LHTDSEKQILHFNSKYNFYSPGKIVYLGCAKTLIILIDVKKYILYENILLTNRLNPDLNKMQVLYSKALPFINNIKVFHNS